jgi:recombination protein RecT
MTDTSAITVIEQDLIAIRPSFESVRPDDSINFEREVGFALQILAGSDLMMKTAIGNRQSVIDAITNVAAIGITLNPALKQAYLVPREGKICLDISYRGLVDLATDTGSILWAQSKLVHQKDNFVIRGIDQPPIHEHHPFDDRGEIVGVYVVAKTRDGDYLTETMDIASVFAIRDRSQSWKAGKATPWKTDPGEMIRKTCVKRASKSWPRSKRLDEAIHLLNTDGGEGLSDLADNVPRGPVCPQELLAAATAAAGLGVESYKDFFMSAGKESRRLLAGHHEELRARAAAADKARTVDPDADPRAPLANTTADKAKP